MQKSANAHLRILESARRGDAIDLFLKATKNNDRELLRVFINTVLGETFNEQTEGIEAKHIMKRCRPYKYPAPDGVQIITAGADVQKNRIETEVVGWSGNGESWGIDYRVFIGDTEEDYVWKQLDLYWLNSFETKSGAKIHISCAAVDSGYLTKAVFRFCRARFHRNIFPVKGQEGWGKGYLTRPKRKNDDGVFAYKAHVDEIKNRIYSTLAIEAKDPENVRDREVPGYCHFPVKECYNEDYFKMLTSERKEVKLLNGYKRIRWILPKGRRNEALDCRAYALTALNILNPQFDVIPDQEGEIINAVQPQRQLVRRKRKRVLSNGIR